MNKIGLMTWYHYHNYGSALQATALYKVIQAQGYSPCFIQYHPRQAVCDIPEYSFNSLLKKTVNKLKNLSQKDNVPYDAEEREKRFLMFLDKHITETEAADTFPELYQMNDRFDAFVCGSDQIWAPSCFDEKYFLSFVKDTSKMIAYAPSLGLNQIENADIKAEMKTLISRFNHLSVREIQGAELIKELCGADAKVVLDPTLLLNAEEWNGIEKESDETVDLPAKKYLLCYFLGDERKYMDAVRKIASAENLQIVLIPSTWRQKKMAECFNHDVGPAGFLKLIRNAGYVCTDSFHGTAFSVNYQIPFTVFKRFKDTDKICQNSRIYSLLHLTALEDRVFEGEQITQASLTCDFKKSAEALKVLREQSKQYLQNALMQAAHVKNECERKEPFSITDMCCGCGACAAVCPVGAAAIKQNASGFWHFEVDETKCIRCGKCQKVCPNHTVTAQTLKEMKHLYSYRTDRDEVLKRSSSGGAAFEIARMLNERGYWVSGVIYDQNNCGARHILINPQDTEKLALLQGSKYLQSYSASAIKEIAGLPKGEKVVFFGTPCQAAGLDKIFRSQGRRNEILLVDLICHGVPSQMMYKKYLAELNEKYQIGECPSVEFRSEKGSWRNRHIHISDSVHEYSANEKEDPFYVFFRHGLCNQESCYDCPYRQKSAADIRVGDYWGGRFESETKGVSMLLANTENGNDVLKCLPGTLNEYNIEEYWSVQFPVNPPKPVFYQKLINAFADEKVTLSDLRKEYAVGFEKREKLGMKKRQIKKWIGR